MALTQVSAGNTAVIGDVNQYKDALEGASGATVAYHLRVATGQNFLMTLPDNAAARKFSIRDSDLAEIFNVDSNGGMKAYGAAVVVGTATAGAFTTAGVTTTASVSATGAGTFGGALQGATVVSAGALTAASADIAGTLQLGSSNITTCTAAGLLKHEAGGLEFDASAIAAGGLIRGSGTGTMAILAKGDASQVLTMAADASNFAWADAGGDNDVYVHKAADETVNNSTSFQDDNHLTFSVTPTSKDHAFWGTLYCDGPAAADIKINYNASGNADVDVIQMYINTGGSFTGEYKSEGNDQAFFTEAAGTEHVALFFTGIFHSDSSSGDRTFTLRWAQNSAVSADTMMKKGSWIAYRQIQS